MMGLPEGWVTDVPGLTRNEQLKALGNGVVPQQAALALRTLAAGLALMGPAAAAALALFAAVVERWLFFAEAQHVSSLFYGAKAA